MLPEPEDVESYEITLHRTELLPGGRGALIGYSDDFPDRQFLVVPEDTAPTTLPLVDWPEVVEDPDEDDEDEFDSRLSWRQW